ncbi:MAG: LD-carboxypeptidase [Flavobacteriaceae bacterium]|jgi:muramoyltetrapeptide carboxypeptidase|nr:LD-carboxypeptidase [Flavobacteriaceae bacterium]
MISPNYLKEGATVAIVSTARKISKKELIPAITILKKWGLKVVLGKSIEAEEHQFAGNDKLRTSDFQAMLDHPGIDAVWCARGGYGTVRIIDQLDFSNFKKHPKWIIGYSDVTVLHSHIHQLGIETLHAQMPVSIETKPEVTINSIKATLFGEQYGIKIPSEKNNSTGKASGQLIGGNLSILYSLCGSPSALKTKGKILFIEDLDEYLYHIDRMLQNLKRNGTFDELEGLIVGGMTQLHDNEIPFGKSAEEIILSICLDYNFPIAFNFPAGHVEDNRALIMGREVSLEIDKTNVKLKFKDRKYQ